MRWLWGLVALLTCGWVSSCPKDCTCRHERGLYVANCSSLPYSGGKLEELTVLPSRGIPIELSDGQFNSARHLKYLTLRNSSIYIVHKKAFYGAKHLVEIDLSFNYIEELDSTVFQHLNNLSTLVLRGNPIQFVSEVPFLISSSLQHLDIGQCKITSIPRVIFYGLKRLRYLSLDGNFLKSLKYNSLPKGLKYLNLSNNLIINVPTEVISALTNLRRIGLSGNPINCSCSLMNLQDWLSGRGVISEDDVTCALPFEYRGVSWSKVDENRLCLDEARREEMVHSTVYKPLHKNRFYKENYFGNGYVEENVQSDQPQSLLPDSQAEVLFTNDETIAMGEMMRDEEVTGDLNLDDQLKENKEVLAEGVESKSHLVDDTRTNEKGSEVEAAELKDSQTKNTDIFDEKVDSKEDEIILSVNSGTDTLHNSSDTGGNLQAINENSIQEAKLEGDSSILTHVDETGSVITNSPLGENSIHLTKMQRDTENNVSSEHAVGLETPDSVNLNNSRPVEYKPFSEEELNVEADDFKQEGLFHVDSNKYKLNQNSSLEESTILPDVEGTTDDDVELFPTGEGPADEVKGELYETTTQHLLPANDNGTVSEDQPEEDESAPAVSELPEEVDTTQNTTLLNAPTAVDKTIIDPSTSPGNDSSSLDKIKEIELKNFLEEKVEPVGASGAEVVMFCIGVLIICLILYSIYKCRNSNKRQSMRIVKDTESNRGTEMQDMASLLPKPQDGEKKNNTKYPDKAPSSETMKLITEQNENETPPFTPVADAIKKIDDKNSLNNNTNTSPTSKTPLIKPGKPITINPAAPIQRTKVKVGIIPDSIPRTPIFLQKAYNGTKNV